MIDLVKRLEALAPATVAGCFALLAGSVALYFPLVAAFAFVRSGNNGLVAAGLAAMVCLLSASLALAAAAVLRGPKHGVSGVLLGMIVRMTLPLVAGVALTRQGGPLAEAGVFGLIVAFYLFTLAIETWLSAALAARSNANPSAV